MRFLCRKHTWEGRSPVKLLPPQPVPACSSSCSFCIPVEMGLNPPDQKVLPAFDASHKATPASDWDNSPF